MGDLAWAQIGWNRTAHWVSRENQKQVWVTAGLGQKAGRMENRDPQNGKFKVEVELQGMGSRMGLGGRGGASFQRLQ